ncbi:unnamed protein product [Mytilus coruscus]|uniref:Uncharacterized protein n=1 Tax=Mytilus coruscus TaxID=42192 RepID=A0A6J8E3K6_MYTCO|nr:unnamed protein product [Mytilus coruscus]
METKLKAIRAGNRAAVTKLWTKFEELKENPDNVKMEEFIAIEDAETQKLKILHDLNEKMVDGGVIQWSTFHIWDSYESTIHFNSSLTPIQKFSYLKAQLLGTAAQTIAGFALTHGNYETAVCLLRERFGHPQKIINAYMKALTDLPSPLNDLNSLRSYGDYLESYARGLECLGQTQEMHGVLLVPIIISKLPVETRKSIAREYDSDHINLSNLKKNHYKRNESDTEKFWDLESLGKRLPQHDEKERFTKTYQQRHRQELDQNEMHLCQLERTFKMDYRKVNY